MVMEEENSMKEHLLLQKKAEEGDGGGDGGAPTLVLIFSIFVSVCGSFVSGCAVSLSLSLSLSLARKSDQIPMAFSNFFANDVFWVEIEV